MSDTNDLADSAFREMRDENPDGFSILASAINNLAEAIHRHADLQMGEEEDEDEPIDRDVDMAGRPQRNR